MPGLKANEDHQLHAELTRQQSKNAMQLNWEVINGVGDENPI